MSNEGTPLDTLFPVGCDESLYAKFPKASQGNAGWGAQFQMYLDKLPDMVENMPEQYEDILRRLKNWPANHYDFCRTGNLFFASAVQVATPKRQVGASHHNSVLFINGSHMSFLALAQEGHFNSTLDIPLSIIKTMTNTRDTASQVASQCVNLELLDDPKRRCYLDSRAAVLNNVWFSIWEESLDNIRDCVKGYNPEVRVLDGEPSTTGPSQNASQSQRNKTSYTNLEQSPENQSSIQSGGPDAGSLRSLASEEHFQKEGLTVLSESDDLPEASHLGMKPMEGSIAPLNPLEDLGRSDAVCQEDEEAPQNSIHDPLKVSSKNAQTKELDTPANVIPAIPRPNKVKPKAKKPIVRPSIGAIGKEVGSQSTETKLDASAVDVLKAKRNGQLRPAVPVAPALPLVPNPEYLNDVFELPIDDEELGPTKKSNKGAAKSKPKAPAKVTGRLGAARVDTKKRQSAIKPKPKAAQGSKGSIPTPANPSAKTRQAEPEPGAISDAISEYDIDQLQAQDADKPDVSDAVAKKADQVNDDDDLYNATPQKPALKPESNLVASKAKTLFTAGPNKTKDSGLDLASKLDGILEHLDSDSEKHSPQQAVLETSTVAENCTVQSKFEQGEKQRVSPAAGVSNNYEPDDEPETEEKIDQISSPGDASDGLSLTELDLRPVPSSVASRSNTTPSLVEDPSTEERKIARKPGPAVNLSKRETYPDKQASTGFSKKASKLILGRQSIGESDVATNETPEQPASDHEDGRIVTQEQKKRKVLEFRNVPSKRRRLDEDEVDVQQGQDEASNPVPEPYHHERKAGLAENPMQPDPISLESRPMPDRNLARVSEPSIVSDTPAHESSNIRKDVDRKPRVIGFSSRGPRNQGIGSVNKIQAEEGVEIDIEHATQIAHLNDRKRKRVKATLKDPMNAHKKRYSSPVSATMAGVFTEDNLIDVDQAAIESSPPASEVQHKPVRHQKGLPRQFSASSSQPLRINRNGSPIAGESPVDHIKLLKERLAGPAPSEGAQAPKPAVHDPSTPLRERRHSQIFGPTIILGKKLKARPASPGEAESRYVPHEKTNYGAYNAIDSKKVIEPKRNLADPFIERARKSNRFTERLHSSASKENAQTAMRHEIQGNNRELPRTLVQGSPTARVRKVATHRYQVDQIPVEFPRGAVERNSTQQTRYENSLTSGTSLDSVSSESARTPLQEVITPNERWNVVLRPHYDTLGQAVHRIADVSFSTTDCTARPLTMNRRSSFASRARRTRWGFSSPSTRRTVPKSLTTWRRSGRAKEA